MLGTSKHHGPPCLRFQQHRSQDCQAPLRDREPPSRAGPPPPRAGPSPSRDGPLPSRDGPPPSRDCPLLSRVGPPPLRDGQLQQLHWVMGKIAVLERIAPPSARLEKDVRKAGAPLWSTPTCRRFGIRRSVNGIGRDKSRHRKAVTSHRTPNRQPTTPSLSLPRLRVLFIPPQTIRRINRKLKKRKTRPIWLLFIDARYRLRAKQLHVTVLVE
jgi:hypothetical protein